MKKNLMILTSHSAMEDTKPKPAYLLENLPVRTMNSSDDRSAVIT